MQIRDMPLDCIFKHPSLPHAPQGGERSAARRTLAAGRFLLPALFSILAGGCAGTAQAPVINQVSHVRDRANVSSWPTAEVRGSSGRPGRSKVRCGSQRA